jgi:hypothetical protein
MPKTNKKAKVTPGDTTRHQVTPNGVKRLTLRMPEDLYRDIKRCVEVTPLGATRHHETPENVESDTMRHHLVSPDTAPFFKPNLNAALCHFLRLGVDAYLFSKEKNKKKEKKRGASVEQASEEKPARVNSTELRRTISQLRRRFTDQELVDDVIRIVGSKNATKKVTLRRQVNMFREIEKIDVAACEYAFEQTIKKPGGFTGDPWAWVVRVAINREKEKPPRPNEPSEWKNLRKNYVYCEQTGDWAQKDRYGKPDYGAPRKPHPEGMPRP